MWNHARIRDVFNRFYSVRRAAEPVSVAAKSEMLTPVFAGGVVAEAAPLVVVEAVTS